MGFFNKKEKMKPANGKKRVLNELKEETLSKIAGGQDFHSAEANQEYIESVKNIVGPQG